MSQVAHLQPTQDAVDDDEIRDLVRSARIPVHVTYENREYFKMVARLSYFDALATSILNNNECRFSFLYRSKNGEMIECDPRFPVGVAYDVLDPDQVPWRLALVKTTGTRVRFEKLYINALKHAEYVEENGVSRISALSRTECDRMYRSMQMETYDDRHAQTSFSVATRFHFSDGKTLVKRMKSNATVFGMVQGILISQVKLQEVRYLKYADNWMHICFPNASTDVEQAMKNRKIQVVFRSVGSAPIVRKNVVRLSATSTASACSTYVRKNLNLSSSARVYLYLNGLFAVHDDETLYNLCTEDDQEGITLYYSLSEAWL